MNLFVQTQQVLKMTDAGKEIIEIFKIRKKFTLVGNKEFWEIISYENGEIININGETYGNSKTRSIEISASEALNKIIQYFEKHSQIWEKKSISTDTEILEYWKRWKHEG